MRRRERGSQFVEAGLALLPFCALLLLVADVGWAVWVKATLQHAVREGARYGVTGQTADGLGQMASIRNVVKNHAMGLLNGDQAPTIAVRYYEPGSTSPTSSNAAGNVIEVSVEGYSLAPLAPLLRSSAAIAVTVRAADVLEQTKGGSPPL